MNSCLELRFGEDVLERYAMGKLSSFLAVPFEDHLVICPVCQARLASEEEFVLVVRTALSELELKPVTRMSPQHALVL